MVIFPHRYFLRAPFGTKIFPGQANISFPRDDYFDFSLKMNPLFVTKLMSPNTRFLGGKTHHTVGLNYMGLWCGLGHIEEDFRDQFEFVSIEAHQCHTYTVLLT